MTWYHVSTNPNLSRCLTPRCPRNKYASEPNTRRICVSSSILGCVCARYTNSQYKNAKLYLYRIHNTKPVMKPSIKQVCDACLTSERWVTSRSRVELIGEVVKSYGWEPAGYLSCYTKGKTAIYIGGYTILDYRSERTKIYTEKIGRIKMLSKKINKIKEA